MSAVGRPTVCVSAMDKVGRVTHRAGTTMRYVSRSADNSDTMTIVSQ